MENARAMTALVEFLDVGRSASREERTHLAADFVRESTSATMVKLTVDSEAASSSATSISAEASKSLASWPGLIDEDFQVVRATGVRRETELPGGHSATCLRETGSGLVVTVCCVFDQKDSVAADLIAGCRLVLYVVLRCWNLEDERRELRNDNIRLSHALDSRVVIEQAKGVLIERWSLDPAEAFDRLRQSARKNGATLSSTAAETVRSSKEARQSH